MKFRNDNTVHNTLILFSVKCQTPEIPAECLIDTDGENQDEIDKEEEEVEQEDNDDRQTTSHTGSARTVGKGLKSAKGVQHKLSLYSMSKGKLSMLGRN